MGPRAGAPELEWRKPRSPLVWLHQPQESWLLAFTGATPSGLCPANSLPECQRWESPSHVEPVTLNAEKPAPWSPASRGRPRPALWKLQPQEALLRFLKDWCEQRDGGGV